MMRWVRSLGFPVPKVHSVEVAQSPRLNAAAARDILSAYLAAVGPLSSSGPRPRGGVPLAGPHAPSVAVGPSLQVAEMLLTEAT
jgi:hypothetical protein